MSCSTIFCLEMRFIANASPVPFRMTLFTEPYEPLPKGAPTVSNSSSLYRRSVRFACCFSGFGAEVVLALGDRGGEEPGTERKQDGVLELPEDLASSWLGNTVPPPSRPALAPPPHPLPMPVPAAELTARGTGEKAGGSASMGIAVSAPADTPAAGGSDGAGTEDDPTEGDGGEGEAETEAEAEGELGEAAERAPRDRAAPTNRAVPPRSEFALLASISLLMSEAFGHEPWCSACHSDTKQGSEQKPNPQRQYNGALRSVRLQRRRPQLIGREWD
mmetsp:Transcript_115986/g.368938  ORF Transcript_115986/g.368938 Transcript_115986/m.368938 type:complete len:275 (-) Transcript_115986:55-879(-)